MIGTPVLVAAVLACCPQDDRAVAKSLSFWLSKFESGGIELTEAADADGRFRQLYRPLDDEREDVGTHYDGLNRLLEKALAHQSAPVARAMLELAATGTGSKRIDIARRPGVVRAAAIGTLGRLTATHPIHVLIEAAAGRDGDAKPIDVSLHCAALRALGALNRPVARPTIQAACEHTDPDVRLAAVEALHATRHPRALDTVCTVMDRETDPRVAEKLAKTAHLTLTQHLDRCSTAQIRRAVHCACRLIGRTDWHADLAAIELCAEFRNAAAVEPLIRVLERFRDHPEDIDRGRLSGMLRHRAHAVLESLTGARIAATDPAAWREFWDRVRDDFVLAKDPEVHAARTTSGFFGVPVVGVRVVFVIDRSGSMAAPFGDGDETRFERAASELIAAVENLPEDARFSVVTFSNSARKWRSGFTANEAANVDALESKLDGMAVDGGTNLFEALETALTVKASRYGARYGSPVDEIFLLSDGAPSVGIVDSAAILSRVRELNGRRRVRINTIAIGEAGSLMRALAKENGGRFVVE